MLNLESSTGRATAATVPPVVSSQPAEAVRVAQAAVRAEAERVRASIEAELEHVAVLGYN